MGDVEDLLERVIDAARTQGRDDLVGRLDTALQRLSDPEFRVVVCGEFKKGKSSLVNALLGARVCATDADVATAVPTYVRYGDQFEARQLLGEGPASPRGPDIATTDVDDVATGQAGPRARALEVRLPRGLLAGGTVLIDTPGVSGGLASSHASIALRALAVADVLLFVTDAGAELGAAELAFLSQAAALCPVVLGAVSRTDLYPQWRRVVDADVDHLHTAGLAVALFPLSAPLRHAGLQDGDRELIAESGYPRLVGRLVSERVKATGSGEATAAAVAVSVLAQLTAQVTAEHQGLADGAVAREQSEAWAAAKEQARDLRGVGSRWQQTLYDQMADLSAEVENDLTVRIRVLRREASARIAELPPARMAADLGPWLQQRTTELVLDHQRVVRAHAEQAADAVSQQFGSAAWLLRRHLDLAMDDTSSWATVAFEAKEVRTSTLDAGIVALRGGSAGAMVAQAAGWVIGLSLPVLIPVAVVLAGALAGKSWQSAHTSQVRMVRAETERTVLGYLEEVDIAARKDTRDSVRRLQRRLRETFDAGAAELLRTATRSADQLSAALAGDADDRARRRAEVGRTLAELDALGARARRTVAGLLPVAT